MASEQNGNSGIQQRDDVDTQASERFPQVPWVGLAVPLVIATLIFLFSPNFRSSEGIRSGSLGGDFLQEWVGGYIANSAEPDRIYELDHFKAIQHDPEIVGFQWPEKNYFPAVYPPFFYQLMRPISVMSYPLASKLWLFVSAFVASVSAWLLYRFYSPARKSISIGLFGLIVFVPLITCLNMGQKSAFLLLILTSSFLLLHHGKPFKAGLVFGLIAFKPHLGLVIGLTMLLKRQWWFAGGALLTVVLLVGVSWISGPELWSDYVTVALGMSDYVETGGYQLADSHSLWGATQLTLSKFELPGWVVKSATGILMICVVGLLFRLMHGPITTSSSSFAKQFSGLVIATVLLSPHFYSYDLTILLLSIVLLSTSDIVANFKGKSLTASGWLLLGMFLLPGLFQPLANATNFQFSVPLFALVLFVAGEKTGIYSVKN